MLFRLVISVYRKKYTVYINSGCGKIWPTDFCNSRACSTYRVIQNVKGKSIPLQAWTGPEGYRRLRLQDFMTVGT